jgi:hypothetical protein
LKTPSSSIKEGAAIVEMPAPGKQFSNAGPNLVLIYQTNQ